MRKTDCTKCCWCGAEINLLQSGVIQDELTGEDNPIFVTTHACTGEEEGAEQCPDFDKCWGIV